MEFELKDLKGKNVYLIGSAMNALVKPNEYRDYDYIARLNMWIDCFENPPRTEIVFLNVRAAKLFIKKVNKI